MTAYFIVRAQLSDESLRNDFDRWYGTEHLPDAQKAFKARRAFRGWSETEPLVHCAFYEFDDLAGAKAIQGSEALSKLVAEFDRAWRDRVTRTRDYVDVVQAI